MAAAARGGEPKAFETALQALEAKQLALGQVSRDYKDHLRVRTANLDDLRAALPAEAVLIEFRQFRPVDFRTGTFGEPRLAALLLAGFDEPVLADLGPLAELRGSVEALLPRRPPGRRTRRQRRCTSGCSPRSRASSPRPRRSTSPPTGCCTWSRIHD